MSNELARIPQPVTSLAKPSGGLLVLSRAVIEKNEEARQIFLDSREAGRGVTWLRDNLLVFLEREFPIDNGLEEVAQYLADEYVQVGDSLLIVSSTTGQAIARINEKDIYTPPPVVRETLDEYGEPTGATHLIERGPRLRPELDGKITHDIYHNEVEAHNLGFQMERVVQTQALIEDGDPRLLATTKTGRSLIVDRLRERLPGLLPGHCTGVAREFIDHFRVTTETPDPSCGLEEIEVRRSYSRSQHLLADNRYRNLKADPSAILLAKIAAEWVRFFSETLCRTMLKNAPSESVSSLELESRHLEGYDMWTGSADAYASVTRLGNRISYLPITRSPDMLLGVRRDAGVLEIDPNSFLCAGREVFGRWEVEATFSFSLWVNRSAIKVLRLHDVPVSGVVE